MRLKRALLIARDCDLTLVQEAYNNVNLHSTQIFDHDKISEEMQELRDDMDARGIDRSETITRALSILEDREAEVRRSDDRLSGSDRK